MQAEYIKTKTVHTRCPTGRPKSNRPSDEEIRIVIDARLSRLNVVVRTARLLKRKGHNIRYYCVCNIVKSNDLAVNSPAKSRKHRWSRFERLHSNAMWHADWHAMKDPRMKGLNLITYAIEAELAVTVFPAQNNKLFLFVIPIFIRNYNIVVVFQHYTGVGHDCMFVAQTYDH